MPLLRAFATLALLLLIGEGSAAESEQDVFSPSTWKLLRVQIPEHQRDALLKHGRMLNCTCHPDRSVLLAVPPSALTQIRALADVHVEVIAERIGELIERENELRALSRKRIQGRELDSFFADFQRTAVIHERISNLAQTYAQLAERLEVGKSFEGRMVYALKISGSAGEVKPAIAVNALQHAREWATGMAVVWCAQALLQGYQSDPAIKNLVDRIDWYFIPVVNPDGYEFTHTSDRFWRKNRKPSGKQAIGTDLNRNWSFAFGGAGSSSDPRSDLYRGSAPFSEPETANLQAFLAQIQNLKAHIDMHSFGQLVLGPYAYTDTLLPPRSSELMEVQNGMTAAIFATHGKNYQSGLGTARLLGNAGGTCSDWVFTQKSALSWTFELRPESANAKTFLLPPAEIVPVGQECFAALRTLAAHLLSLESAPPITALTGLNLKLIVPQAETLTVNGVQAVKSGNTWSVSLPAPQDSSGSIPYEAISEHGHIQRASILLQP